MPRRKSAALTQSSKDLQEIEGWTFTIVNDDGSIVALPLKEVTLATFRLRVGDLVQCGGQGVNTGGMVWRIVHDSPPRVDAVRREVSRLGSVGWGGGRRREKYTTNHWCDPTTRKVISNVHLKGHIVVSPVFSFMPYVPGRELSPWATPKEKLITYRQIQKRVRRIDVMELGAKWAELKELIDRVVKEKSE